ncbi:kinase binding protein CGI-121-domain-containing protein [Pyronema domesticum]|uniref:EKC/KEOPS complex subunit CGI121 n=1 Tax=Pyronema omphalodes (strain CBS 100304) TaxID=1076935 RepID=U4LA87_PYROM|nr:kinase binding protein CGI-121-domain-containing protein [Pyronema domesticum]CCX07064.1 Similar to Protein cgi121; acc. no. Q0C9R3 [Pyronema omphalodes CBS 100304]
MAIHTIQLQNIPVAHEVHIVSFKDVENASFLREQLLGGNAEFEYAFVDASTIVSTAHILVAVHQAVHKLLVNEKLRTRNVHSEIVFSLSPNNNITEAFRRFGIGENTKSLLCVKISSPEKTISAAEVEKHLMESVKGTQMEFNESTIAAETDWANVGKCYKMKGCKEISKEVELEVLGKMVMRSVG